MVGLERSNFGSYKIIKKTQEISDELNAICISVSFRHFFWMRESAKVGRAGKSPANLEPERSGAR
jgi:hypothetical protein